MYQNLVEDVEMASSVEYNRSFILTFKAFVYDQAFLEPDNSQQKQPPSQPFVNITLLRIIKTIYEGQAWRLSGFLTLQAIYAKELCDEDCANYKLFAKQFIKKDQHSSIATLASTYEAAERFDTN